MRSLKLFLLTFIFGLFTVAGMAQERQQERQQEGHQERQMQERSIEVTDLPQPVQETLQEDYEDWRPTEAFLSSDPEEGTFYKVKVQNTEDAQETKTLKIATDGEVIDEEEGERKDKQQHQQRDRQYAPAAQEQERGQQERGQQERGQQHMQQEREVEITDLPRQVQETLNEDYEDWRPASAQLTSDPEEYEEGAFYKVKMNKTDNGEQKTKIVKIAMDGEVIDEEEVDETHQRQQHEQQRDRQYAPAAQERGQQERGQERGQQHMQQERDVEITDLPRQVQETLNEDYEDWRPTAAQLTSDPEEYEEGAFYKVTLNKTDNGERETKIVKIAMDGEVIDEEELDEEEFRRRQQEQQRRDGQQQDQHRDGQQGRQYDGQQQQGQHHGQQQDRERTQEGQQHMQDRALQITDLPADVQETLREDYEDWRPVDVQIATDREVYEEGSFYKVRMNKTDNGEQETKIVKIARDGEVIDEEEVDEDFEKREEEKHRRDRQR